MTPQMVDDRLTKSVHRVGSSPNGEIIKILKKKKKLAPKETEHWGAGMKGDGKIYLSDDGEACKIDKRDRIRSAAMAGELFHLADPFTSILQKTGRNWVRQRRKQRTRKTNETKLDLPRRNGRKPRWERKWSARCSMR